MSSNAKGAILALIAFAIFASHDVVIKYLGAIYAPFQVIFFSTLMSFPLVMGMLMHDNAQANLRPVHPWWTALRTFCAVIAMMSAFYAFAVLPLAQTYAILFAMPLLITLLAIPVLGERVGFRRGIAVLVGLAGVIVVLRPGTTELTLGHAAALAAAVFSALASIIVRKIGRDERSVVLLLYPMAVNFVLMALLMPFVYQPLPLLHLGGIGLISVLGFTAGLFMIYAYKTGEAAVVAPMQYSQILWASGYGYFLFDEVVDKATIIGSGIIILSGMYIVGRESAKGSASNSPVLRTRSRGYGSTFRISPFVRKHSDYP